MSNQTPQYRNPNQQQSQNFHLNWSAKSQDILHKWCDRSSPCDRPRTYDKFYHKLPGNYIDPSKSVSCSKSLCTSDADETNTTSDAGDNSDIASSRKKKRRKKSDR